MSFPRDTYPYTNFHELNLGYFIVHFREIFSQWSDLYDQMLNWKDATDEELATWKAGVEADLVQREEALRAELETWKAQTGQDIAGWEDATLAALTEWQTATQAVFEAIRVEAAGSASAAAASAGDAATAKTAAETAQAAAEAAAASVQASAAQITTNTEDIADLKTQFDQMLTKSTVDGWEKGNYDSVTGGNNTIDTYIRNQDYFGSFNGAARITVDSGYLMLLYAWELDGTFVGSYKTSGVFDKTITNFKLVSSIECSDFPNYKLKVSFRRDPISSEIDPSEGQNCSLYFYTDKTLSNEGKPADAKKVGDEVNGIKTQLEDNDELWGKVYNRYDDVDNVLDVATVTDNSYMEPTTGVITANNSYEIAEISLSGYDKLFCSYSNAGILSFVPVTFFDDNNIRVGGYQPVLQSADEKETYGTHSGVFYVIPANATKAVFSVNKGRISIMYLVAIDEISELLEVTIPLYKKKDNPLYGKKIVNFGDSIFGNFRDTNDSTDESISHMIAKATGATVYNAGFGGCRMSQASGNWPYFSMFKIADAIYNGNWDAQETAYNQGSGTQAPFPTYFPDTIEMLKNIDFSTVDYITIAYGTNDYVTGNVFINSTDATFQNEWDYYKGALRYSIEKILNRYPAMRIVVISPCWRWFADADQQYTTDGDSYTNTRGYKLSDYADACKEVAEKCHVAYIDDYYNLGFSPYSYKAYFHVKGIDGWNNDSDGTHPNELGRRLMADHIVGQLKSMF